MPIIAETVAALAGTTTMRARRFMLVVVLGTLPVAFAYAAAGAAVADLDNWALIVAAVFAVAGVFWMVDRVVRR